MNKKYLFKLGAPILALSLVAACGNDDDPDPIEDDAPVEDEAPDGENGDTEAPLTDEDEAPLNQEDDNGNENIMEDDGENGADNNGDDEVLEEPNDIGEDEEE
ncbi:hypothetical protein [Oceanobacillus halophilus]|uniref:DNA primase n=1 Tax=Oceanobacillus halophilus TaxID=930130 RepID=A0A495A4D7_9BACI|nr:hypothetical protein [Oceanobacillus halophilus]RKQ34351.1 hypothetical protein D8M06_08220 [Oceanobacillus halophilus]